MYLIGKVFKIEKNLFFIRNYLQQKQSWQPQNFTKGETVMAGPTAVNFVFADLF